MRAREESRGVRGTRLDRKWQASEFSGVLKIPIDVVSSKEYMLGRQGVVWLLFYNRTFRFSTTSAEARSRHSNYDGRNYP